MATTTTAGPAEALAALIDGYVSTQLVYVAAELGVADALAGGPLAPGDLASTVGADAAVLGRVLRGLAALGVLDELADGRVALTPRGELLRGGVAGSQRGAALARGRLYYAAQAGLLAAAREGGTPFEIVHGTPFFDHLAARPARMADFQASMDDRSAREAAAVVAAYPFDRFTSLVDVGGGRGTLLAAIMAAAPNLEGRLFDRPEVVETSRLPGVGGDFFAAVPPGADAYVLSRVLHDWDDARATAILRTCHAAMAGDATLLIVEAVLPERAADHPAVIRMDLHMLTLLGARERTADQYAGLLRASGFRLSRVIPVDPASGLHLLEAAVDLRRGRPAST